VELGIQAQLVVDLEQMVLRQSLIQFLRLAEEEVVVMTILLLDHVQVIQVDQVVVVQQMLQARQRLAVLEIHQQ
jgi:hypothetical protein